jgi:hypothetical protein
MNFSGSDNEKNIELIEKSKRKKYDIFGNKNEVSFDIQSQVSQNVTNESQPNMHLKMPIFKVKKPESTYLTLEQALEYSGDNSTYPKRVLYLMCAYWVWYSSIIMGFSIFLGTHTLICVDLEGKYYPCSKQFYCTINSNGDRINGKDISSEFGLNCDKSFVKDISYSLLLFVSAVTSIPFGLFSEKYGRKTSLLFSCLLSSIGLIFCGLSTNFTMYMFFLLISGAGFGGLEVTSRIYTSEISATRFRVNSNAALNITWAVGEVFLGFLGLFIQNWR